jgi:hypothetical protein
MVPVKLFGGDAGLLTVPLDSKLCHVGAQNAFVMSFKIYRWRKGLQVYVMKGGWCAPVSPRISNAILRSDSRVECFVLAWQAAGARWPLSSPQRCLQVVLGPVVR